jgi:hypothetical protein
VTDVPDTLQLKRHRDLDGRYPGGIAFRRIVVLLLTVISVLGLANVFGQRATTVRASGASASLALSAPSTVRGGDMWQARFHIRAARDIKNATLTLDPGWGEAMTINTIEPSPSNETSDNGRISLELGSISAGSDFILFVECQVNPTNVAWHRSQNVQLQDGDQTLATIHRRITILP